MGAAVSNTTPHPLVWQVRDHLEDSKAVPNSRPLHVILSTPTGEVLEV